MAKGAPPKPLSRKQRRQLERLQRREQLWSQPSRPRRWIAHGVRIVGGIVAVLGATYAVLSFFPLFSIHDEPALYPEQSFSVPFVVKYESFTLIKDINIACEINDVIFNNEHFHDFTLSQPMSHADYMWRNDTITTMCWLARSAKGPEHISKANIAIRVSYWPWLIPHFLVKTPWTKRFEYVGIPRKDGTVRWFLEKGRQTLPHVIY